LQKRILNTDDNTRRLSKSEYKCESLVTATRCESLVTATRVDKIIAVKNRQI